MSLNDLLKNMDSELFEDSVPESGNTVGEPIYQEEISPSYARALLEEKDFDPTCKYYLITEQERMVVLKHNDHVTITELNPTGIEETEYVLDSEDCTQSFREMRNEINDPVSRCLDFDVNTTKSNVDASFVRIVVILSALFAMLLGAGILVFYILFRIKSSM